MIDVLDRVLDKGIVIDGWGRVSVIGIDLIGIDAWVVVASIQTYLQYAESLGLNPRVPTSSREPGPDGAPALGQSAAALAGAR